MRSVADGLRRELRDEVRRLAPEERLRLAFELGESGLATFMAANGLSREAAVRELQRRRQRGRRPSASMSAIIG